VATSPDIGYAATLDDPAQGDGDTSGLGLVGFAILPHLDHPTMGEAVTKCYAEWDGDMIAYGLKDENIILIEGSNRIRML